jgi:putative SOS response-associated peptidase YedK
LRSPASEGFRWPDGTLTCSFATITAAANAEMAELNDRMLVILEPADWPVWVGEVEGDPGSLLHPSPDRTLRTWPVDGRVGAR